VPVSSSGQNTFLTRSRKIEFIEYIIGCGDKKMNAIGTLDYDKLIKVAQNMGYNPAKPKELNKYISDISKMDLWDISKILFFGK
jgi:hypothetical protein